MLFAGSGAYVVIDKRSRAATDAQATSSDDGNMFGNNIYYKSMLTLVIPSP